MSLLSIVIPTKNRHKYLLKVIESFIALNEKRINLVIHDNSDKPMIISEEFQSSQLIYIHSHEPLSMHENFRKSIEFANTKYISILGDDDFFSHYISHILDFLEKNDADAIINKNTARYWWPDVTHRIYGSFLPGQLRVPRHSKSMDVKKVNSEHALRKCMLTGGTEIYMLPKLYHGIVKKDILDNAYNEYGEIFPGPTPDMSSAVLIASSIKFFYVSNIPFLISGTAGGSAGGKGVKKEHKWSLEDVPWFDKKYINQWNKFTPRVACGPTLWAESALQALKLLKKKEHINWYVLYSKAIIEGGVSHREILRLAKINDNLSNSSTIIVLMVNYYLIINQLKRFFSLIDNISYAIFHASFYGSVYGKCKNPLEAVELIKSRDR